MTALVITRRGREPVRVFPRVFRLTPRSFGVPDAIHPLSGRLSVPDGWTVEPAGALAWFVRPHRVQLDRPAIFQLELISPLGRRYRWCRKIDIKLDLQTSFDPEVHPPPFRNSRRELGTVPPSLAGLRRTFRAMPGWAETVMYRGLYSQIVRLGGEAAFGGGLCSGMARWAGLRALRGERDCPSAGDALEEIVTLHGRQLTDRALLSGLRWFLRGSPRSAYRAVRTDALRSGESLRALDIGVPKLWRPDLIKALLSEGHTVVPYRIRQESPALAYVDCYDPNFGAEPQTIEFRLDCDRYAYRDRVSLKDRGIGMVAVPHSTYARQGTAVLALFGSVAWLALRRFIARSGD